MNTVLIALLRRSLAPYTTFPYPFCSHLIRIGGSSVNLHTIPGFEFNSKTRAHATLNIIVPSSHNMDTDCNLEAASDTDRRMDGRGGGKKPHHRTMANGRWRDRRNGIARAEESFNDIFPHS